MKNLGRGALRHCRWGLARTGIQTDRQTATIAQVHSEVGSFRDAARQRRTAPLLGPGGGDGLRFAFFNMHLDCNKEPEDTERKGSEVDYEENLAKEGADELKRKQPDKDGGVGDSEGATYKFSWRLADVLCDIKKSLVKKRSEMNDGRQDALMREWLNMVQCVVDYMEEPSDIDWRRNETMRVNEKNLGEWLIAAKGVFGLERVPISIFQQHIETLQVIFDNLVKECRKKDCPTQVRDRPFSPNARARVHD